jgi:hypothetical protein
LRSGRRGFRVRGSVEIFLEAMQELRAKRASESFSRGARGAIRTSLPGRSLRILRVLCVESCVLLLIASAAHSQAANTDSFVDARDGGKIHSASGFVCPTRIGHFVRDAVGPEKGADFCAYSASGGVYGTIKLIALDGPYDAKASLTPDFIEEESIGGKRIADGVTSFPLKSSPVPVYMRTYETDALRDQHFRVLFAGAQFGNWAVETTLEYADPRDTRLEDAFLRAVYSGAAGGIATK